MTFRFDPDDFPNEADMEQYELERLGARASALRRAGICTHDSGKPADGGGFVCTAGCGKVFESDEKWDQERRWRLDTVCVHYRQRLRKRKADGVIYCKTCRKEWADLDALLRHLEERRDLPKPEAENAQS